ncbi:DUF1707 SHOCT-like domain-containing protein [Corynebacterium lubricantis]|uniref:DUF1707 SHOCT-like domain-containing protein n=1 Tax=Corynebacterium lubricantis TaxID=541095 RepID=UPI000364D78F|nr:DUF1707 domain-containing protein [Corynebacterium lubricantis]
MTEAAEPHLPRKRATDDERQNVADILSEAMSNGQLNYQEFDDRSKQAWATTYRDELDAIVIDLIDPNTRPSFNVPERPRSREVFIPKAAHVAPSDGGTKRSLGLLGATSLSGDWLVARNHVSIALMGGNYVDLREARFAAQEITISAWAVMGGIQIIVPENVRVLSEGHGFIGAFVIRDDENVSIPVSALPADAPAVRIVGLGFMGAVDVVRAPLDIDIQEELDK